MRSRSPLEDDASDANVAVSDLLAACVDLLAWINGPNLDLSAPVLRTVDRALVEQMERAVTRAQKIDLADVTTADTLVRDACNVAVEDTLEMAARMIEKHTKALERDERIPPDAATAWMEKGHALADRVRELTWEEA